MIYSLLLLIEMRFVCFLIHFPKMNKFYTYICASDDEPFVCRFAHLTVVVDIFPGCVAFMMSYVEISMVIEWHGGCVYIYIYIYIYRFNKLKIHEFYMIIIFQLSNYHM